MKDKFTICLDLEVTEACPILDVIELIQVIQNALNKVTGIHNTQVWDVNKKVDNWPKS